MSRRRKAQQLTAVCPTTPLYRGLHNEAQLVKECLSSPRTLALRSPVIQPRLRSGAGWTGGKAVAVWRQCGGPSLEQRDELTGKRKQRAVKDRMSSGSLLLL